MYHVAPLLVLLAVLWASAINSTFNIGYRHILPIYPTLYILCGAAGLLIEPARRFASLAVVGLVTLFAADSLAAYPHYLAYFNHLLPREQAYQHLVDSNLDWGQDLPGLKRWLDEHNAGPEKQPVCLAYWGKGNPAQCGIAAHELTVANRFRPGTPLEPGLYCISASGLQAVFEDAPGHWNKLYEERYQARQRQLKSSGEMTADQLAAAKAAFEYGQYLRLLAYLRHRQPDANVGYSILIFRLTAEEIEQALNGPPVELDEQPWMPKRAAFL